MSDPACHRVPLERYPGMNRFVLDWLHGDERFLKRTAASAPMPRTPAPSSLSDALVESNRRWGHEVEGEVRRWAAGDTFTIVTGQQVGFAGGPLYTIAKLASMLKIKRDNEARGVPTTAFFWLATEDHDFGEVANIALPGGDPARQQDLLCLKAPAPQTKRPVGAQNVPEALIAQFLKAAGIERPSWLRPGVTFGDSFAELISQAVDAKFIFVDSLLPELRKAGAPLIRKVLDRWSDLQREVAARSSALQAAGYAPPVVPRPDGAYTLLFRIDENGDREIVHDPRDAGHPDSISTSALTRPLLQDFVLRPDLFIGGPAEVAYFAQIAPLHEMLDVPMPRVALRGHVLIARRSTMNRFEKYSIRPEDVFTTPEALVAAHEQQRVAEVRSVAARAENDLREKIEQIRGLALPADHAVARSINRSIGHIDYHFRKLTERAVRALVRKDRERFAAARDLVSTFFPDRQVQDRVVAWAPFWIRHGHNFIERLIDVVEPDTPSFKIVGM